MVELCIFTTRRVFASHLALFCRPVSVRLSCSHTGTTTFTDAFETVEATRKLCHRKDDRAMRAI